MSLKNDILAKLRETGGYVSGESLAKDFGKSRAAVWKAVNALRSEGYPVEAHTKMGYRLTENADVLNTDEILRFCEPKIKVFYFDSIDSTNNYAKKLIAEGETSAFLVVAARQTAGRGRQGKAFYSPAGTGIYMSLVTHPGEPLQNAVSATTAAAVAVAEAAEELTGRKTGIKWVNDVLMENRKISGILTEAAINVESGTLDYAILGIGLNAYVPDGGFPDEISGIAGAIFDERKSGQRARLAALVLEKFFGYYEKIGSHDCLDAYRKRCIVPGREITVISADGSKPATALEIDENYRLRVAYPDKSQEFLSSGEISIKLL